MSLPRYQKRPISSSSSSLLRVVLIPAVLFTCVFINDCDAFAPNRQLVLHFNSSTRQGRIIEINNTPWRKQLSYSITEDYKDQWSLIRSTNDASAMEAADDNYSSSGSNDPHNGKHKPVKDEIFRRRGMAFALFMTYFTVMGAKCALPSVLSQLTSEQGLDFAGWAASPQSLLAQQLTLATCAVAFGKLVLGPVIDRFGGVTSLKACLLGLLLCVGRISTATSFTTFALCWTFVDFLFSSCWAACIHAVHQSFPPDEWAKRIAMLAAAARTGNASAFILFSAVLNYCQGRYERPWRIVFGCSAVLQLIPFSLLWYFGDRTPDLEIIQEKKNQPSIAASIATLRRESKTPEFWLHLVSRSALMVFGSFLLFIPTLMVHVYGCTLSEAANVGSMFALGCLLSVTTGSQKYSKMSRRMKMVSVVTLLSTATLCAFAQLAHMTGIHTMSAAVSTWSIFLWGFSFAIPFYIPPSLYSLNRGGVESSATIADVFDFGGFALLAGFNGYVASIAHATIAAWIPTFCILAGCAATSAVSLSLAVYFE